MVCSSLGSIWPEHHDHTGGWGSWPSGEFAPGPGDPPSLEGGKGVGSVSYKLLSDVRPKKRGYDSWRTRRTLSSSVTALCLTIMPYGWQIDLAEALTLGLDATVIAGTGSGKTLPWATQLLLEENCDKICLVISLLNELEADLTIMVLRLDSVFLPRCSRFMLWLKTTTRGIPKRISYEVYVSNARYMRLNFLIGSIRLEGQALQDHSDISRDVPGRQRVCGTPRRPAMESQHSLHACGRGSLYQKVGR